MSVTKATDGITRFYGKHRDRYLELVSQFPLRPIRTEAELDAATAIIHALIDQESLCDAEDDYLDVLTELVRAYEAIHYPVESVPDSEMLQSLIEDRGMTQVEVAKKAGIAESTVSEVLAGKRKLNRTQIGKLARLFQIDPGLFTFEE